MLLATECSDANVPRSFDYIHYIPQGKLQPEPQRALLVTVLWEHGHSHNICFWVCFHSATAALGSRKLNCKARKPTVYSKWPLEEVCQWRPQNQKESGTWKSCYLWVSRASEIQVLQVALEKLTYSLTRNVVSYVIKLITLLSFWLQHSLAHWPLQFGYTKYFHARTPILTILQTVLHNAARDNL